LRSLGFARDFGRVLGIKDLVVVVPSLRVRIQTLDLIFTQEEP
jgi:hypothetical protein